MSDSLIPSVAVPQLLREDLLRCGQDVIVSATGAHPEVNVTIKHEIAGFESSI
jgi:hypothetical protein